jgi:3D (Asp-Asp-Asp) domain-containing protein
MNKMKRIASFILVAGFLICGANFNVFAAEEETTREVEDEYKTCYEEGLTMIIVEEDEVINIYSQGRTIQWKAEKVDETVYTSCDAFIRSSSPNINNKDELCLPKGTKIHRIGISENGWDIIKYEDSTYFIWYNCVTNEKPIEKTTAKTKEEQKYLPTIVAAAVKDQEDIIYSGNTVITNEEQPYDVYYEEEEETTTEGTYVGYFELTAYCATGNPCKDGVYPQVGYTAACNDSRLWHHWVYIEGYGTYYIHDTGGMAVNVIDIFMGSYGECIQFGRRSANVYIVD